MKRVFACLAIAAAGSTPSIAADSVYLSALYHGNSFGAGDKYVLIAPYYTDVETHLSIAITKTTATNSNQSAKAPTILSAKIQDAVQDVNHNTTSYKIRYAVNCDLTSVFADGDSISADKIDAPFIGDGKIVSRDANGVIVVPDNFDKNAKDDQHNKKPGGTFTGITCPNPGADTYSVGFSLQAVPRLESRRYLYWKRDPFFDDAVNIGIDANGMLSNAQSASTQQITAIITEIAGAVASVAGVGGRGLGAAQPTQQSARKSCNQDIITFVKGGSYFGDFRLTDDILDKILDHEPVKIELKLDPDGDPNPTETETESSADTTATIEFTLAATTQVPIAVGPPPVARVGNAAKKGPAGVRPAPGARVGGSAKKWIPNEFWGIMAFLPVPISATAQCFASKAETFSKDGDKRVLIAPTAVLNLYSQKRILDPTRDFLTNPQDGYTFTGGIVTGHKYSGQSAAKTVVDTITAPIRAIMPSMNVTQSTSIQSGGGKPDQTTTTTTTTTSPPKAQ